MIELVRALHLEDLSRRSGQERDTTMGAMCERGAISAQGDNDSHKPLRSAREVCGRRDRPVLEGQCGYLVMMLGSTTSSGKGLRLLDFDETMRENKEWRIISRFWTRIHLSTTNVRCAN